MPAGRRQPLARAISEYAKMRLTARNQDAIGVPLPRHLSSLPYSLFS